jgi:hypothetical protein
VARATIYLHQWNVTMSCWQCAAKLSGNDDLCGKVPQTHAIEWFLLRAAGRGMDAPSRFIVRNFLMLYTFDRHSGEFDRQDASWHSSHSNGNA